MIQDAKFVDPPPSLQRGKDLNQLSFKIISKGGETVFAKPTYNRALKLK